MYASGQTGERKSVDMSTVKTEELLTEREFAVILAIVQFRSRQPYSINSSGARREEFTRRFVEVLQEMTAIASDVNLLGSTQSDFDREIMRNALGVGPTINASIHEILSAFEAFIPDGTYEAFKERRLHVGEK